MNVQINQLVKSLLRKETIEDCSVEELRDFAQKNPYFGAAQLILTKKLKTEQSAAYEDQLQKTLLYFNNPLWVEKILNDAVGDEVTIIEAPVQVIAAPVVTIEEEVTNEITAPSEIIAEPVQEESNDEPIAETDTSIEEVPIVAPEPVEDANSSEAIPETATSIAEARLNTTEEVVEEQTIEEISHAIPAIVQPNDEVTVENAAAVTFQPDDTDAAMPETDEQNIQLPPFKEEPFDPNAELVFEPFHTVDYFASQGIEMKEEAKPVDKFGVQLKSFTDWLKTMKRLPAVEISNAVKTIAEDKVEAMAADSLTDRAVDTETMAEVWEKQGNTAKAIEIYTKLSLQDPAKNLYFASKIEALKKQN